MQRLAHNESRHTTDFRHLPVSPVVAMTLLLSACLAQAELTTWTGAGDWFVDSGNWSAGVPEAGDDVLVANGTLLLTNDSLRLNSFTMTNGTFIFSTTDAVVRADNVWITRGTVTHVTNTATATNEFGEWPIDGRVYFRCTNFYLASPGKIDVSQRGWRTITNLSSKGYGPGAGDSGGAGGYGGHGGNYLDGGGRPYGSISKPDQPGSGAGPGTSAAGVGAGGGLVWIDAAGGTVSINGSILADGTGPTRYAASGGGIWITCDTLAATNGSITANGGDATATTGQQSSGGGGRISVNYVTLVEPVGLTIQAARGGTASYYGDIGTIYLPDTRLFRENWNHIEGQVFGPSAWGPASFTLSNTWVRFAQDGFTLTVTNDLTIDGSSALLEMGGGHLQTANGFLDKAFNEVPAAGNLTALPHYSTATSAIVCGGNLVLTNGGDMRIFSGPTNVYGGSGALVDVAGDGLIYAGSWIYPMSNPTNGGSPLLKMGNLTIPVNNAGINGYQGGFLGGGGTRQNGYGPGYGGDRGGGGYGGIGGGAAGGGTYGVSNAPIDPGSGGGREGATQTYSYSGGAGGGLIRLEIANILTLEGQLKANGRWSSDVRYSGGGSGGGINVACRVLKGTTGFLSAKGGDAYLSGGGGGGGRIVIASVRSGEWAGSNSVVGGASSSGGDPGTIVWIEVPPGTGGILSIR